MKVYTISRRSLALSLRSGMQPLAEELGAHCVYYDDFYRRVMKVSWRAGQALRIWGVRNYGSTWNSLVPWWDEWRFLRVLKMRADVIHFLWGEFASPRFGNRFHHKANLIVGTFHASSRKLPAVLKGFKCLKNYDGITLMSKTQVPYFLEQGVDPKCMQVILHGVDSAHFMPPEERRGEDPDKPLQCLMVGSTERDHAMTRAILEKIPKGIVEVTILTAAEQRAHYYSGLSPELATFPDRLDDEGLLHAYQQADLLLMPMLDCTANNAILESMACGTPVMVNRVGGIPEYVDVGCNIIVDAHNVDGWIDRLLWWRQRKETLMSMRPLVRKWAEGFNWALVAPRYKAFYNTLSACVL